MRIRSSGITKLWLDKVLNFRGGWKPSSRQLTVLDFEVIPESPDGGVLSSATCHIVIRYPMDGGSEEDVELVLAGHGSDIYPENVGDLRWFAKFPPSDLKLRQLMTAMGKFEREHAFYQLLMPAMLEALDSMAAPHNCYSSIPDGVYSSSDEYDICVVMDDLSVRGFKKLSPKRSPTMEETKMALKAMARFHALGIEVARKLNEAGTPEPEPPKGEAVAAGAGGQGRRASFADTPLEARLKALPALEEFPFFTEAALNAFEGKELFYTMADAIGDLPRQEENSEKLRAYLDRTPWVMDRIHDVVQDHGLVKGYIHGESWINNFLFRYKGPEAEKQGNPAEVKMIDFQMCHHGLPQADLQYFLNCSGLSKDIRAKFEDILRDDYYQELFRVLGALKSPITRDKLPFDEFVKVFRGISEYGLVMSMIALPLAFSPRSSTENGESETPDGAPRSLTAPVTRRRSLPEEQITFKDETLGCQQAADLMTKILGKMVKDVLSGEMGGLVRQRLAEVVESMAQLGVL